uniref:Protease Do-like 14 n=1 Tax=Aegilops tauschii TaxID=37682 RepID=M8AUW4_AEGTA
MVEGGLNGGGCGRRRRGIEWIHGASLAASPRLTATDVRAFDVDDRDDGEDDEAGGVESCGARSMSGEASCGGGSGKAEEAGDMKREGVRTRSQTKKQKASTSSQGNSLPDNPFEEEFGSLSDSGQGNNKLFFACTGIITVNTPKTTSFLTSLSLVRSIDDNSKIFHDMRIEVRLPDNKIESGWLQFYDLKHNVAVINIIRYHSLQVACLDHQRQIESQSKVVAVGRCFNSGKLMATAGMLTDNPRGAYREELAISTCEITMTGVGGPLVDFNGNFVGMNFYDEKETPFLPRNTILELLSQFSKIIPWWATSKNTIRKFPRPHKSDSQGRKRCFACTGVFIDCNGSTTRVLTSASLVRTSDDENTVADNLKIVVCLPDNRRTTGTLQHYSLHYNIAVVHIMGFCCSRTAQIDDQMQIKPQMKVVAVGRGYKSGKFMATSGIVIDKPSKLDCKELKISTCKITKAGIGGPLIDFDGNLIGMNFYGLEETPYVPVNIIVEVLKNFDAQGTWNRTLVHKINSIRFVAVNDDHSPNRWPVPKPFWCYPTWHKLEEEVDLEEELKYQREQY